MHVLTTTVSRILLAALLFHASVSLADEWDVGTDTDNTTSTDNTLFHGSEQAHDVAGLLAGTFPDQDWFLLSNNQFSSYQFVVDGMTGDLDFSTSSVQRLDGLGSSVLESGLISDFGGVVSLNWLRGDQGAPSRNLVRIKGAACGASCDSQDRYRARFYDTTYTVPRFNNTATQSTVLLVQNASDRPCIVTFIFLDNAGALLNTSTVGTIPSNQMVVLATATAVPDKSGSVRIVHTCGYGGLAGKAVSIEPATGLTFDTPMLHRPN